MPVRIVWTEAVDSELIRLRAEGASWDRIAGALGLGRNAVIERGRRIGAHLPYGDRANAARPAPVDEDLDDPDRPPLSPGHPVAWAELTHGTLLEGTPFRPSAQDVIDLTELPSAGAARFARHQEAA